MAVPVSSSSEVVVVDILSFLGSGSGCVSCGGGVDLGASEPGLSIFSGLCDACTWWSTSPLQFQASRFVFHTYTLIKP